MKSALLKSARISSEVCIITKPVMMLKIIKTKIYFHSIFHFSYHDSEEPESGFSLSCFFFFFPPWLLLKCLGLRRATSPVLLASFKNLPFRNHSDILVVFFFFVFF